LTAALLLAALALIFDRMQTIRWQGSYPVRATVERTGIRLIKTAAVVVLFRWSWVAAEGDPERIECGWKRVDVADGSAFTVEVLCGGTSSGLGRDISYVRQEVLVLKVDYADGERQLVIADVPESRSSRELVLRVP
jgi:hypothetical protein